jgi:hypothetical protein
VVLLPTFFLGLRLLGPIAVPEGKLNNGETSFGRRLLFCRLISDRTSAGIATKIAGSLAKPFGLAAASWTEYL